MDLSSIWEKAQGDRELPEPAGAIEVDAGPFLDDAGQEIGRVQKWDDGYSADQMRDFATPDPAALQRFAEAVIEQYEREKEAQMMPIRGLPPIPMTALNEEWAERNHRQSLAALASRGGLAPSEALAIIERRWWEARDEGECAAAIRRHVKGE